MAIKREKENKFDSAVAELNEQEAAAGEKAEKVIPAYNVPHGWQDHFVSCDDQVDLGNPGTEKFVTLRKKTVIFVNGTPYEYKKEKVTYEKIVELAHVPAQAVAGYIVKYSNGPSQNPSGLMSPGTEVYVCNKMDFNVRSTHQS